jgi:REP element-mobilizing transposase RayT
MPEHVHLLFSEPECGDPSRVMAALRASRTACCAGFAQAVEYASGRRSHLAAAFLRLRGFQREETSGEAALQHRRPVERGLVLEPQQWAWSSFRQYASDEAGSVLVNELRKPNSAYENRLMPAA